MELLQNVNAKACPHLTASKLPGMKFGRHTFNKFLGNCDVQPCVKTLILSIHSGSTDKKTDSRKEISQADTWISWVKLRTFSTVLLFSLEDKSSC